jgi:hypothetical protein
MKKYIVVDKRAVIAAGNVVMLNDAQAKTRMQNLISFKKGRYEVLHPIEFKRGEVIGFEKEIKDKGLLIALDPFIEKAVNDAGNADPLSASTLSA